MSRKLKKKNLKGKGGHLVTLPPGRCPAPSPDWQLARSPEETKVSDILKLSLRDQVDP